MQTLYGGDRHSYLDQGGTTPLLARVCDRLPQVLVLIFENQHQRALLRHVSAEQFHRRLQVVAGKSRNRFFADRRKKPSELPAIFSGSVMGAGFAPVFGVPESTPTSMRFSVTIRLKNLADGANALAGLPVVLARHNARESGEFVGKRSGHLFRRRPASLPVAPAPTATSERPQARTLGIESKSSSCGNSSPSLNDSTARSC